jgi:hypothetical protein
MTEPKTSVVMKSPPPSRDPTPMAPVPCVKEAKLVKKSGAPLPRARSVTPATLGESCSVSDRRSRLGTRYSSAVEATVEKRISSQAPQRTKESAALAELHPKSQ